MWNYHHPYQHLNRLINVFMVRRFFAFIDPPVLQMWPTINISEPVDLLPFRPISALCEKNILEDKRG